MKVSDRKRATTIDEYRMLTKRIFSNLELTRNQQKTPWRNTSHYRPRPDDIIITPFSKSGTTWLQQIFHCLRTRGDMDFQDISEVVPWIETSPLLGINLNAEQRAKPRGYKSHLPYNMLPLGAKYINAVRHPNDAAYSLFKFMEGWFIEPGTIPVDEFIRREFLEQPHYYRHLLSWWHQRHADQVLFLVYEYMLDDLEGTIKRVAEFINIPLDEALLALTLEHASLQFMQAHLEQFDDASMRRMSEKELLPPGSDSAKVRAGKAGGHRDALSTALIAELDARWQELITPEIGFDSYEALIASLALPPSFSPPPVIPAGGGDDWGRRESRGTKGSKTLNTYKNDGVQ